MVELCLNLLLDFKKILEAGYETVIDLFDGYIISIVLMNYKMKNMFI